MRIIAAVLAILPAAAFAQADSAAAANGAQQYATLLPLVAIFGVFYFLLIKPQQKKMKQHQAMLTVLKKGDEVVTGGGIVGKITKVGDADQVTVEIAKGVEVSVLKATIATVLGKEPVLAAPEKKKTSAKNEKNDNLGLRKDQVANDN